MNWPTKGPQSSREGLLFVVAATCTVFSIVAPMQFGRDDPSCWKRYPVSDREDVRRQIHTNQADLWMKRQICSPSTLASASTRLPRFLRGVNSCETLLCLVALATWAHWICVSRLVKRTRWMERNISTVCAAGLTLMLVAGWTTGDAARLFLQVLPVLADCGIILYTVMDCFETDANGGETIEGKMEMSTT